MGGRSHGIQYASRVFDFDTGGGFQFKGDETVVVDDHEDQGQAEGADLCTDHPDVSGVLEEESKRAGVVDEGRDLRDQDRRKKLGH